MKKHFSLAALFWLFSALAVWAVPVTFNVDFSPRITSGEFDPNADTVEVRGSFNNWAGGFTLTHSNQNSVVFSGTIDISGPAGTNILFKFVQVSSGSPIWESTPNRTFTLPSVATNLPIAFFNDVWEGAPIPVKFQVNMASQQAAGAFNPAAGDFVEARGSFNNWTAGFTLAPSASNPAIFEGTTDVPQAPGARVEYKFVINRSGGQLVWENDPNRAFTQAPQAHDLPVVFFNNIAGVPVKAATLFQVDMSVQIAAGLFDTNAQEVFIRGNKMGWGNPPEGVQLLPDSTRPGLYTNVYKSDAQITGDRIEYKATIWTPDTMATTWEDGANKTLTFTGTEPKDAAGYHQLLVAPAYFNNVAPGDLLNAETIVTFRVDMRNARTTTGTAFNPQSDYVSLNGSFLTGGWQPWTGLLDTQAHDDGASGGDTTANDGIYSVQVTLPRAAAARLEYKFGINGLDNEAPAASNHVRYVRVPGAYTLPVDTFGSMIQESTTDEPGSLAIARSTPGRLNINWLGQTGVRLQKFTNLSTGAATDVPNTEGRNAYEVLANEPMAFFRLLRP